MVQPASVRLPEVREAPSVFETTFSTPKILKFGSWHLKQLSCLDMPAFTLRISAKIHNVVINQLLHAPIVTGLNCRGAVPCVSSISACSPEMS